LGLLSLIWLLATVSIGMQSWIGDKTIYANSIEQRREELHFAILSNQAPGGGSWGAVGALSIQKRVGVIYLAEVIRQYTGLAVGKIYKLLDTLFLFISLLALFFYLRQWVPDHYCIIGTLYVCAVLPYTYFFQLFHPWDRLQLAIWIGLLYLTAKHQVVPLAVGLVISVVVKFDAILLPLLYFLAHASWARWRQTGIESLGMFGLVIASNYAMGQLFPAPLDQARFTPVVAWDTLVLNLQTMIALNFKFPPLLVHALPFCLALLTFGSQARFARVSVVLAVMLLGVFGLFTRLEEVRAQMMVLVLLLPSALLTTRQLLEPDSSVGQRHVV